MTTLFTYIHIYIYIYSIGESSAANPFFRLNIMHYSSQNEDNNVDEDAIATGNDQLKILWLLKTIRDEGIWRKGNHKNSGGWLIYTRSLVLVCEPQHAMPSAMAYNLDINSCVNGLAA